MLVIPLTVTKSLWERAQTAKVIIIIGYQFSHNVDEKFTLTKLYFRYHNTPILSSLIIFIEVK